MFIKICIISTDGRNGQDQVNVSKKQFLQKYGQIQSNLMELTEKNNKSRKLIISGPRRIATCALKAIQEKLSENNIDASFGTITSLTPFFITFARDKEIVCANMFKC